MIAARAIQLPPPHDALNRAYRSELNGIEITSLDDLTSSFESGNQVTCREPALLTAYQRIAVSAGELDELAPHSPAFIDRFSGKQLAGNAPVVRRVPLDAHRERA